MRGLHDPYLWSFRVTVEWQIHHAHTCPQNNVYSSFSILATAPNDVDVMNVEVSSRTIHRLSDHDKTKIGGRWMVWCQDLLVCRCLAPEGHGSLLLL